MPNGQRRQTGLRPSSAFWIDGKLAVASCGKSQSPRGRTGTPAGLAQKLIAVGKGAILLTGAAIYAVWKVPIVLGSIAVIVVGKITVLLIAGAV
jgi:hypothetical protein